MTFFYEYFNKAMSGSVLVGGSVISRRWVFVSVLIGKMKVRNDKTANKHNSKVSYCSIISIVPANAKM